jgi:hypothetical protein
MKPIQIALENDAALVAALAAVNGWATAFTVTQACEVHQAAADAEKRLETLPKASRAGARAEYVPGGPAARAYKYAPASTRIRMERRASGWYLTGVIRTEVYPGTPARLDVAVTQTQADDIARRAVAGFTVLADA